MLGLHGHNVAPNFCGIDAERERVRPLGCARGKKKAAPSRSTEGNGAVATRFRRLTTGGIVRGREVWVKVKLEQRNEIEF